MPSQKGPQTFGVRITVLAAGPVLPRRKYKEHKLLSAERQVTLPFVPYPGLYLRMSMPGKRNQSISLYLRVRAVEWSLTDEVFCCMADEMLGSNVFNETFEVRGAAHIEKHFNELGRKLAQFGFTVDTTISAPCALNKYPDGNWIEPPPPKPFAGLPAPRFKT